MYTIQYATGARVWDIPKRKLHEYVCTSEQDITAIYERATPITQRVRKELAALQPKTATPAALRFMFPA